MAADLAVLDSGDDDVLREVVVAEDTDLAEDIGGFLVAGIAEDCLVVDIVPEVAAVDTAHWEDIVHEEVVDYDFRVGCDCHFADEEGNYHVLN